MSASFARRLPIVCREQSILSQQGRQCDTANSSGHVSQKAAAVEHVTSEQRRSLIEPQHSSLQQSDFRYGVLEQSC
jgi:hypothetical protein